MKEVKKFEEAKPERTEIDFILTLDDGHSSRVKLKKEFGEWILIGDNRQHLCFSELDAIADKIEELNDEIETNEIEEEIEEGDCF